MSGKLGTSALFLVVVFCFVSAFALNNIAAAERSPVLVTALRALIAALATSGAALLRGLVLRTGQLAGAAASAFGTAGFGDGAVGLPNGDPVPDRSVSPG